MGLLSKEKNLVFVDNISCSADKLKEDGSANAPALGYVEGLGKRRSRPRRLMQNIVAHFTNTTKHTEHLFVALFIINKSLK